MISGQQDLTEDPPVLTIIVEDKKDFSASELNYFVTKTFLTRYALTTFDSGDEDSDLWREWEEGRFRKILKRAKTTDFNKIIESTDGYLFSHAGNRVFYLYLHRKSQEPESVKRAQVSGLTVVEEEIDLHNQQVNSSILHITVNSLSNLSPAKAAIACAHVAHQSLLLDSRYDSIHQWFEDGDAFTISESAITNPEDFDVVIYDAGLTEVEAGTITAVGKWIF